MKLEHLDSAELSDVGKKRKNNEDSCIRIPERGVFCVADGMGGVVGGDLASETITTTLKEVFAKAPPGENDKLADNMALFAKAANQASKWIKNFADEKVIGQMGSTIVGLLFDPRNPARAVALHAGDSRLYCFRAGELKLLTQDHTAVAALAAKLGRDPASLPAKYQNELVRAVGLAETVELERTKVEVRSGDIFFLCSDGLSRMVSDHVLAKILKQGAKDSGPVLAKALINSALDAGGKDNVTVVLVKVGDISGLAAASEPEEEEEEARTIAAPVSKPSESQPPAEKSPGDNTPQTPFTPGSLTPDTWHGDTPKSDDRTPDKPLPPLPRGKTSVLQNRPLMITATVLILALGLFVCFNGKKKPLPGLAASASETPTNLEAIAASVSTNVEPPGASEPPPVATNSPAAAAKPPETPPVPVTGSVAIDSVPSEAAIFQSGTNLGKTPFRMDGIQPGQISFVLSNLTHTGAVMVTVAAGQTVTTNVTLEFRRGILELTSDPTRAEVWIGGVLQTNTPAALPLPAHPEKVTLKYPDLEERVLNVEIAADAVTKTNAVFSYGKVALYSQPAGAMVSRNGKPLGPTPWSNNIVPPGPATWNLTADGYEPTNLITQVLDHKLVVARADLRRGRGRLNLEGDHEGIEVTVDGGKVGVLPTNILVEAGMDHTVTANYKGQTKSNPPVRVAMNATNTVAFVFEEAKAAESKAAESKVTEKPPSFSLKDMGLNLVKVPGINLWVTATRLTLKQYEEIMQGLPATNPPAEQEEAGQRFVVNISYGEAKALAEQLTTFCNNTPAIQNEWPTDCQGYRFAVPSAIQWQMVADKADALGINLKGFRDTQEWCLDANAQGEKASFGGFRFGLQTYGVKEFTPQPAATERRPAIATRLVLVP